MIIKPLRDYVLIQPDEPVKVSPGGIVIPDKAAEKPSRGKVHAAGPDATVQVGMNVYYGKYAGQRVDVPEDEMQLVIMREEDIVAVDES